LPTAKDIVVRPITSADANRVVRRFHYSGKVVNNSQLHFGVFLGDACGGAMSFGPPLDRRKLVGLVRGTKWNEFLELNRMAFGDLLPRNSESRALAVAFRLIRKAYPHVQWVVSFADAAQCGDGTIYRAAGFVLTSIKRNNQVWEAPQAGPRESRASLTAQGHKGGAEQKRQAARFCRKGLTSPENPGVQAAAIRLSRGHATKAGNILETGGASMKGFIEAGFKPIPGFQLRYVYFLDPTARERLTVPVIPFAKIGEVGAGMYKGKPRAASVGSDTPGVQPGEGGAIPTAALSEKAG
jgi:hypothetical protein